MSLKIIKFEPKLGRIILIAAALLCVVTTWFGVKWNFANAVASRLDTRRPEFKPIADWLTAMAPADPQTHLTAARVYQRTFDTGDLTRSLNEYEMAAALSPFNYVAWVDLGKARGLNGDPDGAQAAYSVALRLAPNYAAVQWVDGNSLIRAGNTEEGFGLIAKAAASDPQYSQPAVATALQIFDHDIRQVVGSLGDTDVTNAALAIVLAGEMHFEESFAAWSKLQDVDKTAKFKELGEKLIEKYAAARKFQLAAGVAAKIRAEGKPTVGQVANGGFENGVKMRNAGLFEWQIADGVQPQIGLSETQPHGGQHSLLMIFNSFETAAFRDVSQTVAVVPGAEYELEAFYRSDIKSLASLKLDIVNALTSAPITSTAPATPTADWARLRATFTVPADTDGVIIRLVRDGCAGPSCPMSGSLALDDISLRRL